MKKAIASILAVIYLVFTTFTFWHLNDAENHFRNIGHDVNEHVIATFDGGFEKAKNNQLLAGRFLTKAPQHLSVTGKINIPRGYSVSLPFGNFFSFLTAGYAEPETSTITPVLSHAHIFLRNGVLRI